MRSVFRSFLRGWILRHQARVPLLSQAVAAMLVGLGLLLSLPAKAELFSLGGSAPNEAVVRTPYVSAELVAYIPNGLQPGEPAWLGLQIKHIPGWHSYWVNPGDSGLPTELQWQLPEGVQAGEIQWPVPSKFRIGSLANYGYEDTVLLPVPLTVEATDSAFIAGPGTQTAEFVLHASWLVCKQECIPESGTFRLKVPVFGSTAMHAAQFQQAFAAQPVALPQAKAQASAAGNQLRLRVEGLPAAVENQPLELFSEAPYVIRHGAILGQDWQQNWADGVWTAEVQFSADRDASPKSLGFVLKPINTDAVVTDAKGWRVEAEVTQPWSAAVPGGDAAQPAILADGRLASEGADARSWSAGQIGLTLALALLGGALLNLMPCVFPILAIKALSIVKYAGHAGLHEPDSAALQQHGPSHQKQQRVQALLYGVGVVATFLALGGVMLVLRALGMKLGWGFQLQSPWFVAALAVLFTLIGLSLAGVFSLGAWAPQGLMQAKPRSVWAGALGSGVLAVLIAAPCTGPFMGAALGASLSFPSWAALLVFLALGVGMALPFMGLVWFPALLNRLPKPGAWMVTFQKAMAFPMFATVIWLLWVLTFQIHSNGVAAFLLFLWALSLALWLLGQRPGTARAWAIKGLWLASMLAAFAVMVWAVQLFGRTVAQASAPVAVTSSAAADKEQWQPWSAMAIEEALKNNQPVFVDFTASWCITCQYNKLNTLSDKEVLTLFADKNVLLLRADWTRQNPEISAALQALGRNGVPTYALYQLGLPTEVMTEILDKSQLRSTLARLPDTAQANH